MKSVTAIKNYKGRRARLIKEKIDAEAKVLEESPPLEKIIVDNDIRKDGITRFGADLNRRKQNSRPSPRALLHQKLVTKNLFKKIGIDYVPGRLVKMLDEYDAFTATYNFLKLLDFDYATLELDPKNRRKLNEIINIIVELEYLINEYKLIDDPFYKIARNHNIPLLEKLITKYRKAGEFKVEIDRIIFAGFKDKFYYKTRSFLANWHRHKESEFESIYREFRSWADLQKKYDAFVDQIQDKIEKISNIKSKVVLEDVFIELIEEKQLAFNSIVENIKADKIKVDGDDGWEQLLKNLVLDFIDIEEGLNDLYGSDESDPIYEDINKLEDLLPILGLDPSEKDLKKIKSAYRELMKKCHPDLYPDDEEKKVMSQKINTVYEKILELL